MTIRLNPYLGFRREAREAMEHYRSILGGELTTSTFAEFGVSDDPADADLLMHSMLTTPEGLVLMAADTPAAMEWTQGSGDFSVSLSGDADDEARLRGVFDALATDGQVLEPLVQAPWGDAFGMVKDRFGITWLVNVAGSGAGPAEG